MSSDRVDVNEDEEPLDPHSFLPVAGTLPQVHTFQEWLSQLEHFAFVPADPLLLHPIDPNPPPPAVADKPVTIQEVNVHGLERTKRDFVDAMLAPLKEATTMHEVFAAMHGVSAALEQLGFFKHVDVYFSPIEPAERLDDQGDPLPTYLTDDSLPVSLVSDIRVAENKFRKLRVAANGGNSASSVGGQIAGSLLNIFGRGESLSLTVDVDQSNNRSYFLNFRKPLVVGRKPADFAELSAEAIYDKIDYADARPYSERRGGVVLKYAFQKRHALSYEHFSRDLQLNNPKDADLSISARAHAGKSVKSALRYTFKYDGQDHPAIPSSGVMFRAESELAGLFGDVKHFKQTISTQVHFPLSKYFDGRSAALGFLFRGGLMIPFHQRSHSRYFFFFHFSFFIFLTFNLIVFIFSFTRINDRFMSGGTSLFHGFDHDGVGPRDRNDSLGSEGYGIATVDLRFPLPQALPSWIQGHVFGTLGTTLNHSRGNSDSLSSLLKSNIRHSLGFGIVSRVLGENRFEFNICFAQNHKTTDRPVRWEFGFSDILQ